MRLNNFKIKCKQQKTINVAQKIQPKQMKIFDFNNTISIFKNNKKAISNLEKTTDYFFKKTQSVIT